MIRVIVSILVAAALSAVYVPSVADASQGVWYPHCYKTSSVPDDPPICH